MFRNRRISFIVGAGMAFLMLILQALPPFTYMVATFKTPPAYRGVGLVLVAWILLLISLVAILALGVIGATLMMKEKYQTKVNKYGIFYNISLFLPFLFALMMGLGDLVSILALLEESVPDVLSGTIVILYPGVYVILALGFALPISSHYKKIRKFKNKVELPDNK